MNKLKKIICAWQIGIEKEEGEDEEEKEEEHRSYKDVINENCDDIYNIFTVKIPYGDAVNVAKIINALSFRLDEAYIYYQKGKGLYIRNIDPSCASVGNLSNSFFLTFTLSNFL